jgi:hypothetical protein
MKRLSREKELEILLNTHKLTLQSDLAWLVKEMAEILAEPITAKPAKDKLKGQRLGQVIFNALYMKRGRDDVMGLLFHISDEDLTKLINDYLKEV